jgi:hypothetical protein
LSLNRMRVRDFRLEDGERKWSKLKLKCEVGVLS